RSWWRAHGSMRATASSPSSKAAIRRRGWRAPSRRTSSACRRESRDGQHLHRAVGVVANDARDTNAATSLERLEPDVKAMVGIPGICRGAHEIVDVAIEKDDVRIDAFERRVKGDCRLPRRRLRQQDWKQPRPVRILAQPEPVVLQPEDA